MIVISFILFFICPLVALPFIIYGLINDKKHRFLYCLLITLILSIISYHYTPSISDDLYRHQLDVMKISRMDAYEIMQKIFSSTEQLSFLLKVFVANLGNVRLLQFIVTFITYSMVFYIACDASNKNDIQKIPFVVIILFLIFSINYITVVSNLFSFLGLTVFSLGIYLEYYCNSKKTVPYLLYLSSLFIHSSLVLPLLILVLFKLLKEKINLKVLLITILLVICIGNLIVLFSESSLPLASEIHSFYINYFINDSNFSYLHTNEIIVIYFLKLIPFFVGYFLISKNDKTKIDFFTFLIFIVIIVLFFQTTFSIRFIPIVQLCGIPIIVKCFKDKKNSVFLLFIMIALLFPLGYYQYLQFRQRYFGDVFYILIKNIISIFRIGE